MILTGAVPRLLRGGAGLFFSEEGYGKSLSKIGAVALFVGEMLKLRPASSPLLVIISAFVSRLAAAALSADADPAQIAFFEKSIRPVLAAKCYKCHAADADKVKGGLLLDTREGIRAGGDSGHAVVPGNVDESLLIKAIRYADKDMAMPPQKSGGKLPDAVIADFETWIKMGAPDPRESTGKVTKKEIDFDEARKFWAFQPPRAVPVPKLQDPAWPLTDVDRFILAGLEAKGLKPVADAEPRVLLRRIYFDLVGLPPAAEEADAFAKDVSPDALAKVVDRLLASPQFGERWGRHWMDVARYAESTGKERNYTYPEAWRYRDYVIASLNADKPYDQFIREQIAGDLLPAKDAAERSEHLIATGFLALGPKGLNEKNRTQFEMDVVDEQLDTTARAVLGLTVGCARCHDHKFDPIPTRDYYALAGIFRSTRTLYGTSFKQNASSLIPLADSGVATSSPVPEPFERKRAKKQNGKYQPTAGPAATGEQAMGVQENRARDWPIYIRGEVDNVGPTVPRGFLTVLTPGAMPALDSQHSGRIELADWLTSEANPLTARVMANRVWLHLFGDGLVRTADNFGATGERPSHPELLDYLALEFVKGGWSVKNLIRTIVLSRTYRMSSAADARNFDADPDNLLVWRASPRRLDAEAIRDAILSASGELNLAPPTGSVVANVGDGYVGKAIKPELFNNIHANYRSVYLPIVRDFVPDALAVFDFAEPSLVVAARDVTNVPSQALYMMNNAFVLAQAKAMAKRVLSTPLDDAKRIALAYQLALARPPTEKERARADAYLHAEGTGLIPVKSGRVPVAAETSWATFCQALFASAEFRYLR